MMGYSTHDDSDLFRMLHFLTTVWYADSDAESEDEESADNDLDIPYQFQLPNGVNHVHLTWEIEQLPIMLITTLTINSIHQLMMLPLMVMTVVTTEEFLRTQRVLYVVQSTDMTTMMIQLQLLTFQN